MMRRWLGVTGVLLLSACSTKNIGDQPKYFSIHMGNMSWSGDYCDPIAVFKVEIEGGTAPYRVVWDFVGARPPGTVELPAEPGPSSTVSVGVFTGSMGQGTATVTVTDSSGQTLTESASFLLHFGFTLNMTPRITSLHFDLATNTITVEAEDSDECGDYLDVSVKSLPAGFFVDDPVQEALRTTDSGPFVATFHIGATNIVKGATGTITFTVTDASGSPNSTSVDAVIEVTIPPLPLPADTLWAVPEKETAATGEPVRVLVVTGVPAHPFCYMTGVGLVTAADASYVPESFDVGAVDTTPDVGTVNPVDGIWAEINEGAGPTGGFLLAPDFFIGSVDIGDGRERWDFNITPIVGSRDDIATSLLTSSDGALFNLEFTFSTPGTKTFGFEAVRGVKRTYYGDGSNDYFWGDISNDGSVVPNALEVD